MNKINVPETAINEVTLGKSVDEVLARCEISGVFERREWMATASTIINLLSVIQMDRVKQLSSLAVGMLEMCDRDRNERLKQLDTVGTDSATGS